MATSHILETPRLRLEPFAERHLSTRYVAWLNDPQVVRYSEQRFQTHTLESCRAYWQSYVDTPHCFWAIIAKEGALGHIGNINAYIEPNHGVADLGILIGERHALRQGFGSEAWSAVCAYLFSSGTARKISAGCLAANLPMTSIMKRAGMVPDGVRLDHYLFDGKPMDIVHSALFNGQWDPSYPAPTIKCDVPD